MYAWVMKWREGRARAIKGMVMPVVKKKGTCRGRWNKRGAGELKRTSSGGKV